MKAIFAVTALAAAISAQAIAADTEITTSVSGAVTFVTEIDLVGSTNADGDADTAEVDVYLDEEDDADDGGGYGAYIDWDIVNGPFSANIELAGEDDVLYGTINDVMVSEGAYSFGQLGEMIETHEYTYVMDEAGSEGADVDAAFRYTTGGLAVQLEGVQGTAGDGTSTSTATGSYYGIGAQYTGSADALSYVVEGQFRASTLAADGTDAYTYFGAGATYSADAITAAAAVNNSGTTNKVTELGFSVEASVGGGVSAYAKGVMWDLSEEVTVDSSQYLVGASMGIDTVTVTAEFVLTGDGSFDETNDFVFLGATMDSGALSYYAEVEIDVENDADPFFEAGVSTTTESGITYAADFDFQADVETEVKLTAAYSF